MLKVKQQTKQTDKSSPNRIYFNVIHTVPSSD